MEEKLTRLLNAIPIGRLRKGLFRDGRAAGLLPPPGRGAASASDNGRFVKFPARTDELLASSLTSSKGCVARPSYPKVHD